MQNSKEKASVIQIDGSQGEGGGQILRTALALSALSAQACTISNIRAGRPRPGLMRQHRTCIAALAEICGARVSGNEIGSMEVSFIPDSIASGDFSWSIGSAGSTSLVLQTVIFPLLSTGKPSRVTIEGGTHNSHAPSFEFLDRSLKPLLTKAGFGCELVMERSGFYPAGGGRVVVELNPASHAAYSPIHLDARGEVELSVVAKYANVPQRIAESEVALVGEALGIPRERRQFQSVPSSGPGNVVMVIANTDLGQRVFTANAEARIVPEHCAADVVAQVQRWMASGAAVDEYLQDQLLLPMSLGAGGRFSTVAPSSHTLTNMQVIKQFLPVRFDCVQRGVDLWDIEVCPQS